LPETVPLAVESARTNIGANPRKTTSANPSIRIPTSLD
jgi:hypothetical protein